MRADGDLLGNLKSQFSPYFPSSSAHRKDERTRGRSTFSSSFGFLLWLVGRRGRRRKREIRRGKAVSTRSRPSPQVKKRWNSQLHICFYQTFVRTYRRWMEPVVCLPATHVDATCLFQSAHRIKRADGNKFALERGPLKEDIDARFPFLFVRRAPQLTWFSRRRYNCLRRIRYLGTRRRFLFAPLLIITFFPPSGRVGWGGRCYCIIRHCCARDRLVSRCQSLLLLSLDLTADCAAGAQKGSQLRFDWKTVKRDGPFPISGEAARLISRDAIRFWDLSWPSYCTPQYLIWAIAISCVALVLMPRYKIRE